jgi:hypothetical protein
VIAETDPTGSKTTTTTTCRKRASLGREAMSGREVMIGREATIGIAMFAKMHRRRYVEPTLAGAGAVGVNPAWRD